MALPIAAIVGRPNVGKSTLFNRIIRRREAIVDETAGVTRDRHYTTTDWCGREFIIVDTGGYMIHFKDEIDKGIKFQVEEAIDEADVVLFMTEIGTGVTDIDLVISKMLQKSKKTTIMVTNKVDSLKQKMDIYEFLKLGFGEPMTISALHGKGVGDLLDEVIEKFPEQKSLEPKEGEISMAILGKPNVGKSSIVNALYGKDKMLVTDIPGTTRDAVDTLIKRDGQKFRLIDTAGLRKRKKVHENIEYYSTLRSLRSLERCHIAVIIVDAQEGVEFQDLKILEMAIQAKRGILIVLNKWDLVVQDDKTFVEMERKVKDKLRNIDYINILSSSAIRRQRTFKMLDVCKEIYSEWQKKVDTSRLNEMLEKAIKMNHPPSYRGRVVAIKYVTQTGEAPPVFSFFCNYPKGIAENYRRYLNRQIRENFGFSNIPITLQFRKK
ncbi:MAG: ribosome biogenesis GTPase Der [bacterium]|nr:ribosome biogenesis GTPase Der [bacterium]